MRDGKECLQVGERAVVDALYEAFQCAKEAAVGNEQKRKCRCDRRGQNALLHGELVGQVICVVYLDLAGDRGANLAVFDLGRIADADRVDCRFGAPAEGNDVAVGGKAMSDIVGDCETLVARAQQYLRRSKRASAEDHNIRGDRVVADNVLAIIAQQGEGNLPASGLVLGNVRHLDVCEQFRAVVLCIGQVCQRDSVLGADVASAAAITTARAGALLETGSVDAVIKADSDGRSNGGVA